MDTAETLHLIGETLWPALEPLLESAPDEAVAELADLAGDWLQVAYPRPPLDPMPQQEQVAQARVVVMRMAAALARRSASAPGLAVRFRRIFRHLAGFSVHVDADFSLLTREPAAWAMAHHRAQLRDLAQRWAGEGPAAVLGPLRSWRPQLALAGSGTLNVQDILELIAEDVDEPGTWAAEAITLCIEESGPLIRAALRMTNDEEVPDWFSAGSEDPVMCHLLLAVALQSRVGAAVADEAVRRLTPRTARSVLPGLFMQNCPDRVTAALLAHPVPEVRATTVAAICPYDPHQGSLSSENAAAWEAAVVSCQPEFITNDLLQRFGRCLELLARDKPEVATEWFKERLATAVRQGFANGLPRACRAAMTALPGLSKRALLTMMPRDWRAVLLHEGLAGDDPSWVLDAVHAGDLDLMTASRALDGLAGARYEELAAELVRRGLAPQHAVTALERAARSGDASGVYGALLNFCSELTSRSDPGLAAIGEAGVRHYTRLRAEALDREHRERVLGI